ncbi:MAG: phosphatidylglycerol lysyltransferase domain-containing protein [Methylococcales bacterium]|nr:phosphatidylglycerol lysyltransferase domain-containing protein [Methylococcales bacterium]
MTSLATSILNRQELLTLVRKWGGVSTGGILDSNCKFFTDPDIPGLIGYRLVANNAVILGDPVCASENKTALSLAFQDHCARHNIKVVYIIASEQFSLWTAQNLDAVLIEFGSTLKINPCNNPIKQSGSQFKPLRKKVHNCQHKGVIVKEYFGNDITIEQAIINLINSWQNARKGPQIHLCQPTPFNDKEGKRWFYAELNGQIIGSLILNQLIQDNSWLLNNVMIAQNSPNGLSELLIVSTLETLEAEHCTSVTIGPIPKSTLGKISGINSLLTWVTKGIYSASKHFFNLGGHETFWEKFQPTQEGSYLIFPNRNLNYSSIKAIIKSLNND